MQPIQYMTSLLTFYLKGEIRQEQNFVNLKKPNTILSLIPLGAKKDFSDLPNYNVVQCPIKGIEKCEEGYKILLSGKLARDIAKGTVVRQHISGGYMYSGGYRNLVPGSKEIELKGKVDGFLPAGPGYVYNKWSSYAKKARLLMLVNWSGKGSVSEITDIELEIEDKK